MERVYFLLCRALGWLLRAGTYSRVRVGEMQVRKHRAFYAPLLVWLGDPLLRILDTGVRVLPQRDWEERERLIYRSLYGASIQVDGDELLVMPCLPGDTLATLLEDSRLKESDRNKAIEYAVVALARFHDVGFTHGDAMAENVMVDLEARIARWFDFETVHDASRPITWRRADDVRALLATCVLRTGADKLAGTLELILDVYGDEEVSRLLTTSLASALRRPLTFHLGQAGLSFQDCREIDRLLRVRLGK